MPPPAQAPPPNYAPVRGGGASLGKLALLLIAVALVLLLVLPFAVGFLQGFFSL